MSLSGRSDAVQRRAAGTEPSAPAPVADPDHTRLMLDAAIRPDLHTWPVQRFAVTIGGGAERAEGPGPDDVHRAAATGISGASEALPHLGAIQQSFGRHSVGHIEAHTDGAARAGAQAMGAEAFATGNHVAFAGAPSLHTAAHEAAHVVQQAAGVHLAGGVGESGDSYERHADAVADRVVRGESAEGLLDEMVGSGRPAVGGAVQHKLVPGPRTPGQNVGALLGFLNALCHGAYVFGVAGDGSITIAQGNFDLLRNLPERVRTKVDRFGNHLARVLLAPESVTIDFVAGSKFLIGNFDANAIDLGDIQTIVGATRDDGDDPVDAYGTLAHEITEQYFKQVKGMNYDDAHGAASELEFSISGWRRVSEYMLDSTQHEDSTYTGTRELICQREEAPHEIRTLHMRIDKNKIVSIEAAPEVDFLSLVANLQPPSPTTSAPTKKRKQDKPAPVTRKDETTTNKSLVEQFLEDLDDDFDMFAPEKPQDPNPKDRPPDDRGGGGASGTGLVQQKRVQQKAVQRATIKISGDDEYRVLCCLSQNWPTSQAYSFEINEVVKQEAQQYADRIVRPAYENARDQLQRALNSANYAIKMWDEDRDQKADLIRLNLKKVLPETVELDLLEMKRVFDTLQTMYETFPKCTIDALNYKPQSSTHTVAYALPGINVIHLLEPFYTVRKNDRERALTLLHECAHIIDAKINHDNDKVWYLNAYTWERVISILDQLTEHFRQQERQKQRTQNK